jgi:acyl-CoA synthetase (AMP-forming)/AMP-acid ligase II
MSPGLAVDPAVDLVHAPLAHWAQTRGTSAAIRCGNQQISFAQLQARLSQRAQALAAAHAAPTVLVDSTLPAPERLIDFLGTLSSGRCAAVGDPDWPESVRRTVLEALATLETAQPAASVGAPQPHTPFYVGYTSGSSGTPKGYRRHHRSWTESFRVCLEAFGADAAGCILAPGRDSQSLFLFGMLLGLWSGGGVVLQERFSASAALDVLRSGQTPCLVAVPSQLLMMLEAARHQNASPIPALRLILVSGSRWMRSRTAELRTLFPKARIIEFYGASETSFVAWMDTDEEAPATLVGQPFPNVELQVREPGADGAGLICVRSPMLFMDYVGGASDATAALRADDWLSVRDLGFLDAQGRLHLVGRQNRMLVTLGKNLFPEEVEAVLERHPAIAGASVHGVADPLRGMQVVALVHWVADGNTARPDALALKAWCRQHLEGFKVPRTFVACAEWCRTASGKTDHRALESLVPDPQTSQSSEAPCLPATP